MEGIRRLFWEEEHQFPLLHIDETQKHQTHPLRQPPSPEIPSSSDPNPTNQPPPLKHQTHCRFPSLFSSPLLHITIFSNTQTIVTTKNYLQINQSLQLIENQTNKQSLLILLRLTFRQNFIPERDSAAVELINDEKSSRSSRFRKLGNDRTLRVTGHGEASDGEQESRDGENEKIDR
ncbi:hypothetical protein Ddye_026734 [Dipteronia dyeriana]|uniref:Uncharacterized protein n=1 Tax=Dipteronia dyeriana TaxID=168575 RepID=A0AAD9WPH4_9ROSI|nr:hypothetical protein Ddye_026734 [Dipteronia dyeriana]